MARPLVEVIINEKRLNAVLDTGAWRSYIRKDVAKELPSFPVQPFQSKLGGKIIRIRKCYVINGIVKDSRDRGYRFTTIVYPAEDLGKENGKVVHILFGAVLLEDWGTIIDESVSPPKVDYSRLRKGTLVEL